MPDGTEPVSFSSAIPWPCSKCSAPGVRSIGALTYCARCAELVLAPIRARVIERQGAVDVARRDVPDGVGVGRIVGPYRPEYGPLVYDLRCTVCGATWSGEVDDPCWWCERAHERMLADQRRLLLQPEWLDVEHGPRYDELDEVGRAVWDRTRGQLAGADSVDAWLCRLSRAVDAGLVSEHEARQAARRAGRRG